MVVAAYWKSNARNTAKSYGKFNQSRH